VFLFCSVALVSLSCLRFWLWLSLFPSPGSPRLDFFFLVDLFIAESLGFRFCFHWSVAILPSPCSCHQTWRGRSSPVGCFFRVHRAGFRPVNWEDLGRMVRDHQSPSLLLFHFVLTAFVRYGTQGLYARVDNDSYLCASRAAHRYWGCGDRVELCIEHWGV